MQDLFASQITRDKLRSLLKEVSDLERLIGRISFGSATPRDLNAILRSLYQVPAIRENLAPHAVVAVAGVVGKLPTSAGRFARCWSKRSATIRRRRSATATRFGRAIQTELDELRSISRNAKQIIATLEATERTRSGISNLRIKFNNVFGYFIEVSKGNAARVPGGIRTTGKHSQTPNDSPRPSCATGRRKSSAPKSESFNWKRSSSATSAGRWRRKQNEFRQRRARWRHSTRWLRSPKLRRADVLSGPSMHDGDEIEIVQGRHPVIEVFSEDPFVPNSVYLNNSTDRLLIITGPNMGGKSTVLRQTAIVCILAQMGSFVPAEKARLPLLDRVWTRVGASDDLTRGRSTFMVEMTETAAILHSATPRSLVLLDEIGRGTATFDGLSIAWAVAEYLHDSPEHAAKTLFATHYHELTELAERLPGAQNYQITAAEREGEVVFLHRLERGRASKSYGIQVARLAGMPPAVLANAREVLARLERYELDVFADEEVAAPAVETGRSACGRTRRVGAGRRQC